MLENNFGNDLTNVKLTIGNCSKSFSTWKSGTVLGGNSTKLTGCSVKEGLYKEEIDIRFVKNGEELLISISFYEGFKKNPVTSSRKWNTIKVLVKNSLYKLYFNGVYIKSKDISQYSDVVRIKFTMVCKRSLKNFIGRIIY